MNSKLSFAQRLAKDNHTVKSPTPQPRNSSIQKSTNLTKNNKKKEYFQFESQHTDLKNLLKLFEPTSTQDCKQRQTQVEAAPSREQLNSQKKIANISLPIKQSILRQQAIKQNFWIPKWSKAERKDYQPSEAIIQSEPTFTQKNKVTICETVGLKKKGIPNNGNTCYINSLVQCLFHLPHFNDYFMDQNYVAQRNGKIKNVTEMYRQLYTNVIRNSSQAQVSTLPLKRAVSKICSLFIDWEQQDAHQFMKQLLNSIHDQLNRVKCKPAYKYMFKELQGETIQKMALEYWNYEKQRDDSYIYDSFCGQTYNNIRCINCNYESECFQNFLDLSISLTSNSRSLEDLFEAYFQPEKLSDFYHCSKCNKSSKKSIKTIQLWKVPKFLIIHLKRSQFGKKNTDPITLPQSFTLKPYMTLSCDKSARFCQYSLCGVIMHQGVLEGGHYWCNVKQNGRWFQIDDDIVQQLNCEQFKTLITKRGSTNAYILFYSSLYC